MDPAVAEPRTLTHQAMHRFENARLVGLDRPLLPLGRPGLTHHFARPTLAHLREGPSQMSDGFSAPRGRVGLTIFPR